MRKFFHISAVCLLLVINLFRMMDKAYVFIDFKLNQDFIAEFLCINKEEPELKCHGKCHLKAQLDETEENSDTNTKETKHTKKRILETEELLFSVQERLFLEINNPQIFEFYYNKNQTSVLQTDVFHPPC